MDYDKLAYSDQLDNVSAVSIPKYNDFINLTSFDFSIQEWEIFIDSYRSMFHNNTIVWPTVRCIAMVLLVNN